jgi:hypothetical protein
MSEAVVEVRRDRRVELALVAGFALVVGFVMLRHEMWRDELQAWLIAKASSSPGDLLHNTRFEGHPVLWYALLWPFAHLSHAPRLEQVIEWVLAVGATALVVLRAPLTMVQKALYVVGYFAVFEYGVLARSYTLGILLLYGAVAAARSGLDPNRRWWLVGPLLAAAAFTSAFGAIVAVALFAGLLVDETMHGRDRRAVALGGLGGLVVLALAYVQARPAAGTSRLATWHTSVDAERAAGSVAVVSRALLPIPKLQHAFWNTNVTDGHTAIAALLGVALAVAVAWAVRRSPAALTTWCVGVVGLVTFTYLKVDELSTARYLGHVFVLLVVAIWLQGPVRRASVDRWAVTGLTALLAVQAAVGVYALARDGGDRFSDAKAVAAFIDANGLHDARIVVDPDFVGAPLAAYLDRPLHYLTGERDGTYTKWDEQRRHVEPLDAAVHRGDVVVLNRPMHDARLRELAHFGDGIVPDEHYWIYEVTR